MIWMFLNISAMMGSAEHAFLLSEAVIKPIKVNPNMVHNFGFEDIGPDGIPIGWVWDRRNTDATCDADTASAHSGRRSLRLTNGTPSGAHIYGMLWTAQPIRLKAGKPYTLSVYVMSEDPGSAWIGGGMDWQFRLYLPPTHGKWRRIWMSFVPSERDEDFVLRIVTESPTNGFWLDDLKLEEGTEPTPCEPADERILLDPLNPERDIEGDGPFELSFDMFVPKPLSKAEILVEAQHAAPLRKAIELGMGAWRISIKGEATGLDDTPRTLALKVLGDGREIAGAETTLRFFSPKNAEGRLSALRQKLPVLKGHLDDWQRKGYGIDYPLVTFTVLENFSGYVEEDIRHGEVRRALMQIEDMEGMAERLSARFEGLSDPSKEHPYKRHVPRWTGKKRPEVIGPSFIAPVSSPDYRSPVPAPVFFVGYGHFGQVRADIEKLPRYGANIIQIEFGPNDIFPEDGVISDAPIREMLQTLDRAAGAGVAVALLISPHYFPQWMLEKYPHLRKRRDGFLRFCLHAPEGQELLRRYIEVIIPPLKDHPALHSICLTNEPINEEEPCEFALKEWHEWLRKRHGDIATLNRRWHTEFRRFEDVPLYNPFSQPLTPSPQSLDFVRFNQDWFAGWHKMLADAVKAIAPDLPVHAKAMTWTMLNDPDLRFGVDAYLFSGFSDINGNDSVNFYSHGIGEFAQGWMLSAMAYDLQRSVKDVPIFNSENHIIPDREMRRVPPEHVRAALWQGAVHGQSATTIWVWERTFDPRSDFAGSIMHRPACVEAVGMTCLDLNRLADEVTALQKLKPDIFLLHSTSALLWEGALHADTRGKLYTALSFTGLKLGFVTERQLECGDLPISAGDGTPTLLIPNVVHLSDAAFENLRKLKWRIVLVGEGDLLSRNEYDERRDVGFEVGTHIERLPFRYGQTTWRDLWRILLPKLAKWGIEPAIQVRDEKGEPIWGIHWLCASLPNRSLVVNLCNYRHDPVRVTLWRDGKQIGGVDLIDGKDFSGAIPLESLQVRLMKLQEYAFPEMRR
jgi:hypothetical protein